MNSPPLRPEQLSPNLSPMAFSLDDPRNGGYNNGGNNLQHLLASPTKLNLDAAGNNSGGNSLIYRTSLSKLSELSRTGRSRQRSNSDTLRSASPIRLQFFNNAPKMLKPEYVAPQKPSGMPLLSALIGNGTGGSTNRLGLRETLEMFHKGLSRENYAFQEQVQTQQPQQQQREQSQRSASVKTAGDNKSFHNDTKHAGSNSHSHDDNNNNNNNNSNDELNHTHNQNHNHNHYNHNHNYHDHHTQNGAGITTDVDRTLKGKPINSPRDKQGSRMASNSSVASSTMTVNFNDMSKEMELEMLDTDKNGFVELVDGKSNRCSFISSSSTDFDPEWYNHQQSHISEETAKLDYRIKQLELEIDELKLQNEKLIRSITTSRTVEDKFMLDALKEIRFSKQRAQRGMERKVKQLERKVENYRKVLKTIGNSPIMPPHTPSLIACKETPLASESPRRHNCRKRIARISSVDLRKIEEQNDSSPCPSSSDGEHDTTSDDENTIKRLDDTTAQESEHLSIRRIGGLQLNIQLETQRKDNQV